MPMGDRVYVLSNGAFRGLVKIGFTSGTVEERASQLSTTGVPSRFIIDYWCEVRDGDGLRIERATHQSLEEHRYAANREFFRIGSADVISVIHQHACVVVREYLGPHVGPRLKQWLLANIGDRINLVTQQIEGLEAKISKLTGLAKSSNPFKAAQAREAQIERLSVGVKLDQLRRELLELTEQQRAVANG